jgi:hypothetical protein
LVVEAGGEGGFGGGGWCGDGSDVDGVDEECGGGWSDDHGEVVPLGVVDGFVSG